MEVEVEEEINQEYRSFLLGRGKQMVAGQNVTLKPSCRNGCSISIGARAVIILSGALSTSSLKDGWVGKRKTSKR